MRAGRRVLAVAAVGVCATAVGLQPAAAADGYVYAAGYAALTVYHDVGDKIDVIDNAKDNEGAVGWIEVQQANGTFKAFPHIYVGGGFTTKVTVTQDVLREGSRVKIVSCIQNGPSGHPYNCGIAYANGS
jgi:hypothetical protein